MRRPGRSRPGRSDGGPRLDGHLPPGRMPTWTCRRRFAAGRVDRGVAPAAIAHRAVHTGRRTGQRRRAGGPHRDGGRAIRRRRPRRRRPGAPVRGHRAWTWSWPTSARCGPGSPWCRPTPATPPPSCARWSRRPGPTLAVLDDPVAAGCRLGAGDHGARPRWASMACPSASEVELDGAGRRRHGPDHLHVGHDRHGRRACRCRTATCWPARTRSGWPGGGRRTTSWRCACRCSTCTGLASACTARW